MIMNFFPFRTTCLKYLVLANMLIKSDINPFDSQEAKPFKVRKYVNSEKIGFIMKRAEKNNFRYPKLLRSIHKLPKIYSAEF